MITDSVTDYCKLDSGRAFIPENNIPNGFGISSDRRVFVTFPRDRLGVYSTLAYFNLDDIGPDEVCPPLTPYPPQNNHTLNAQCCSENIVNINRFFIDKCNRLWAVDRQALGLTDQIWELGSPNLLIFDLDSDTLVRSVKLPSDIYLNYQLGFVEIIINVDAKDCVKAYAYMLDTYNGCIVTYSFEKDRFWKTCSPQFYSDAKYSKFFIKTRLNKEVRYFKDNFLVSCTRDLKNQEFLCHSDCQLDEYSVPFEVLNNEEKARCSPNSVNVKFLGQKCRSCQVNIHTMNKDTQVVWGVQEQKYGVGCWNRENPLTPNTVQLVVSDHYKLPYCTDLELTDVDLSDFLDHDSYHVKNDYNNHPSDNYVVILSNNLMGIKEHGFDYFEENFGFYYFVEKEALRAYPQCLPLQNSQSAPYKPTKYQPAPYQNSVYQASSAPMYQSPPKSAAYQQPSLVVYQEPPTYRPNSYRYKKSSLGKPRVESKQE